ncbi:MAG: hypothetical protein JJLCMIEE_01542 [Acidimicrobiales bacterium]|nr:hypothetical protein [Acidimicrobiales bacterium]RIK05203.1 MAG: hypothetical protein DCC48_11345 [Acidobacteriota bacterium]
MIRADGRLSGYRSSVAVLGSTARCARAAATAVVLLALSSCEVQADVSVAVADDGSGTVEVAVGLDQEATAEVPDLAEQLRTEDLEATGWTVSGPEVGSDGWTWVRVEKGFADPDELGQVMSEVAGPEGAFREFTLERNEAFALTTWELTGVVDLSGGLEQFSDPELTAALGGLPLGVDLDALAAASGTHPAESFTVRLIADLPGEVGNSNAETVDGSAVWEWELADTESEAVGTVTGEAEPVEVSAESSEAQLLPRVLIGAAIAAMALAVLILVLQRMRRRRSARSAG